MNKIALAALAAALLTPAAAFAQDADAPAEGATEAAAGPGAAAASAAPSAPAPAAVPAGVTVTIPPCRLAEHAGTDEASAQTAAQVVCNAILHAGPAAGQRFRVSLGRLGSILILGVAEEGSTIGSTLDTREIRLQGIEEVPVAAPRIAESIVHGTPLADTEKVDNLVGEETRQPKPKAGKTHFALGLVGLLPPLDRGLTPSPGLDLDVHYETGNQRLELGGSMRFGGADGSNTDVLSGFFLFSLGGRYYTADTDFSPYVGGGLTWGYLDLSLQGSSVGSADGSGLGAYADAGFEVLRTHHAHLAVGARLDLPFFDLHDKQASYVYSPAGVATSSAPSSLYYAPVSLEMRLTF